VEYILFIINNSLSQKEVLARLELVRKEATKLTGALLKDYIWQRDDFNLKLEQSSGEKLI
jgi:16S rRNA C1402 (ribose-2'-O) methylase RsmI